MRTADEEEEVQEEEEPDEDPVVAEDTAGGAQDEDYEAVAVAEEDDDDEVSEDDSTTPTKTPPQEEPRPTTKPKGRTPSVAGLEIPFRTVKKAMKLDPDIPIVQNEAALMTTVAAECFLKALSKEALRNAKNRGRHTIRYEDVAEARTQNPALQFLETLLP